MRVECKQMYAAMRRNFKIHVADYESSEEILNGDDTVFGGRDISHFGRYSEV